MKIYSILFILLSCITTLTLASNCYGPGSKLAIVEFDAFPSPVEPGKNLYIRAVLQPGYEIKSGKVQIGVYFTDKFDVSNETAVVNIFGLDLCTLSAKVTCPIRAESTTFEWEFRVPNILPGTYQVKYTIIEDNPPDGNPYSCIQFPVIIAGEKTESFKSFYQATLLGVAVFDHENPQDRDLGHSVQVGPSGPLNATAPGYGSIKGLSGTEDLVPNPYFDTSNFIWGMKGTLTNLIRGSKNKVTHVYEGSFYMGYQNPLFPYSYTEENPLAYGIFNISWVYANSATAQVSGYIMFAETATLPPHWGSPLIYGRIAKHEVVTSNEGFLLIKGSHTYCSVAVCKTASPEKPKGDKGLSDDELGLAIGIPIAAVFVLVLVAAALFYVKRRKESEAEDGVFAVARKPEYGSALVVDDIIQETRGSKTLQAMIDMREEYDDSDDNNSGSESERSRSRTPLSHSRSYSPSRSISRSSFSRGQSSSRVRSGADESDAGDSASRGSSDSD